MNPAEEKYAVIKNYERPSKELIRRFYAVEESASLYEVMGKNGAMSPDIRPVWPRQKVCGSAMTVYCPAGDNLMLHKAVTMLHTGDIIVLNNDNSAENGGMMGEMLLTNAQSCGAVGLITDGACRDTLALERMNFPVWCRGISVHGTTKLLPGTINHTIVVGNVTVRPGDVIFADNDGVVVIPLEEAETVLEKALAREANEEELLKKIKAGEFYTFDYGQLSENYSKLGLTEEE